MYGKKDSKELEMKLFLEERGASINIHERISLIQELTLQVETIHYFQNCLKLHDITPAGSRTNK